MKAIQICIFGFVCCYFYSCVDSDGFSPPKIICDSLASTVTTTMEDIGRRAIETPIIITEDEIIEGIVVSDDRLGNFYKTLIIQSLDGKSGISLRLGGFDTYTKYHSGRHVYLHLKGLAYQRQHGGVIMGISSKGKLTDIPELDATSYLSRSCVVTPEDKLVRQISIKNLTDKDNNTLISISDVQFVTASVGRHLYEDSNDIGFATNHLLEDKEGYRLILRTSSFADFSDNLIPPNSGTIYGVLSKYNQDYQLFIRSSEDLKLDKERFFQEYLSIDALRDISEDEPIVEPKYIEGVITLSGYVDADKHNSRNLTDRQAIIQDNTGAIALYFDEDKHELQEGDRIRVYLSGYETDSYAGQLRLETLDYNGRSATGQSQIQIIASQQPMPAPRLVSLEQLLAGEFPSQLVQVADVQLSGEYRGLTFSGKKSLTNCTDRYGLVTRSKALFAKETLPENRGVIIGVTRASKELILQNTDWITQMTKARCDDTDLIIEQDFEHFPTETAFAAENWDNLATIGESIWLVQNFGENNYVQLSAYQAESNIDAWLITPEIDLTNMSDSYLRFRTKDAFFNGTVLKVYVSINYNSEPNTTDWLPLTANISQGHTSGYGDIFVDSGRISLADYQAPIRIAFRYQGNPEEMTTTMQLDEIQFFGTLKE